MFQNVVGIGLQEIDDIRRYEYGKPSFGSRDAYPDISRKRRQVEKLSDTGGRSNHKIGKFYRISDFGQFFDIPFDISVYIGTVKQSPVIIGIICKFRHTAAVDHVPYVRISDIDFFGFACGKVFFRRNKRTIESDALSFLSWKIPTELQGLCDRRAIR